MSIISIVEVKIDGPSLVNHMHIFHDRIDKFCQRLLD